MKPLKPRDKVTQRMTRDGLTLDNQTTGESVNVSSREAEQEYSAAEPGGAAEKVLERAGDIRDRRKAKRAAKDAGDVVTRRQAKPCTGHLPGCNLPPRNGLTPSFPSTSTRQRKRRISWTPPKTRCRKSALSPPKPSTTRHPAGPRPSCALTRWRNRPPS